MASAKPAASPAFVSRAWGFHIDVPRNWTVARDFRSSYLANGAWKTFAAPQSRGEAIVSLTVPASNQVTAAEIRIGASRDPAEVTACTAPPPTVRPGSIAVRNLNGIAFTTWEAADAAMSHHLDVHAFRVVRAGACYAIDQVVFGVNPQVYDPPATPPFSDAEALDSMQRVMQTFRFAASADQPAPSTSTAAR